jgi:hypothetical protein
MGRPPAADHCHFAWRVGADRFEVYRVDGRGLGYPPAVQGVVFVVAATPSGCRATDPETHCNPTEFGTALLLVIIVFAAVATLGGWWFFRRRS